MEERKDDKKQFEGIKAQLLQTLADLLEKEFLGK